MLYHLPLTLRLAWLSNQYFRQDLPQFHYFSLREVNPTNHHFILMAHCDSFEA